MYTDATPTSLNGKYVINLKYSQGNIEFMETKDLCISYNKEYNEFQKYDPSNLYSMVNHNGKVSEDGKLSINNDGMDLQLYTYDFMPLFMIICVVLFTITSTPKERIFGDAIIFILSIFNIMIGVNTNDIEIIWLYAIIIVITTIHSLVILKHGKI